METTKARRRLGFWWHVRWFWRNRVRLKVVFWWHRHPWRSALWKAHYRTHTGQHPWFLGVPLGCRYCTKKFWQQNRHMRGQEPPAPLLASAEITIMED